MKITHMTSATVLAVGLGLAAPGCEKKPATPAAPKTAQPAAPKDDHTRKDGESHDHATFADLGVVKIAGYDIHVKGEFEPGKEGHFDLFVSGSTEKPAAIRVWTGAQDGRGAMKHKADGDGKEYHAHADVPNPITPESRLWIEIENSKGEKTVGGVALKK